MDNSAGTLSAARDRVYTELQVVNHGSGAAIGVALDHAKNELVLNVPERGLTERQQAFVDQKEAASAPPVRIRRVDGAPGLWTCAFPSCDPPLRGGLRIRSSSAGCTAGFNARSRSGGAWYLLTAGHCDDGDLWNEYFPSTGSYHALDTFHNAMFGSTGDAGIITLSNPSGWDPRGSGAPSRRRGISDARGRSRCCRVRSPR